MFCFFALTFIYQEEGQSPRVVGSGDVITVQSGVMNRHGAADDRSAYIAVNIESFGGDPGSGLRILMPVMYAA